MMNVKVVFLLLALALVFAQAKPSHHFGFHGIPDHLDFVPPVLPPTHFHAADPAPLIPYHHAGLLPTAHFHAAPAPLLPAPAPLLPAPAPFVPAPAPLLPAPAHLLPAPASFIPAPASLGPIPSPFFSAPAPAPLLPAPVIHTQTHIIPAPSPIIPPVLEAIPFVESLPSYRAIPGPKTTTHHLSVGYAFPQPRLAKLHGHVHSVPHAHLNAAPLTLAHHHHHTLF